MKKAIDWFALVIGLALALFGAKWMWTGWDIVQAERGWAAVIAGSVMLTGGLIVATLAWMTMRLASATMSARNAGSAADEPAGSQFHAPTIPAPVVAAGAGAVVAATAARAALAHERAHEAGHEADEEPKLDAADEPPMPLAAPPSVSELLRRSEERGPRDAFDLDAGVDAPAPPRPPVAPPLPPVAPPPPPPPPPAPSLEAELEEERPAEPDDEDETAGSEPPPAAVPAHELSEIPAAPESPAEPEPREPEAEKAEPASLRLPDPIPLPPPADEPVYDDWLERTAREFDRELGRDALPKDEPPHVEPPHVEPPPSPPKAEPAVVGRYSSGDTNYLMFADGSIEAQTPEGVMRFASLTELKRFVEKRN